MCAWGLSASCWQIPSYFSKSSHWRNNYLAGIINTVCHSPGITISALCPSSIASTRKTHKNVPAAKQVQFPHCPLNTSLWQRSIKHWQNCSVNHTLRKARLIFSINSPQRNLHKSVSSFSFSFEMSIGEEKSLWKHSKFPFGISEGPLRHHLERRSELVGVWVVTCEHSSKCFTLTVSRGWPATTLAIPGDESKVLCKTLKLLWQDRM